MSTPTYARFQDVPLVLRSERGVDRFPYFVLCLCVALAALGLALGAPPLPGSLEGGAFIVSGP